MRVPPASGIDFDDDVGFSALIAGEYPQPRIRTQHGRERELWLFNKHTHTATMAAANRLIATQPAAVAR